MMAESKVRTTIYARLPGKRFLRSLMPLAVKRSAGRWLMRRAVRNNAGYISVADGRKFRMIEDRLFLRVFLEHDYEPDLTGVARQLIDTGDITVDVGANYGWYTTLFALLVGDSGEVISYEPSSHSNAILKENVAINSVGDWVSVHRSCVGDTNGTVQIEVGGNSESGLTHVVTSETKTTQLVPSVRLEEHIANYKGRIAYIKIDIEGYEYLALSGAMDLLRCENQPILQLELNDEALARTGSNRNKVIQLLKELGYEFFEASETGDFKLVKSNLLTCSDVFCVGRGVFGERLSRLRSASYRQRREFASSEDTATVECCTVDMRNRWVVE